MVDDGTAECPRHPGNRDGYYSPSGPGGKVLPAQPWCPLCRRARRPTRIHLAYGYADPTHRECTCGWLNCPDIGKEGTS